MNGVCFQLPITSLFMVRNIKCVFSFSQLGREERVDIFERSWRNILHCNKTAPCTVTLLGIKFDVIDFHDVTCLTRRLDQFVHSNCSKGQFYERSIFIRAYRLETVHYFHFRTPLTMVGLRR